jgi:hypothetical protein
MQEKVNSGGISFLALLGLLFIGLKLTGYISWSWWWVLLPFYGGLALVLGIVAVVFILAFLVAVFKG